MILGEVYHPLCRSLANQVGIVVEPTYEHRWHLAAGKHSARLSSASSPPELSEFLWVDFAVENSTGGGVAVTRPVTWQLEYPGQAPEAEKDKMVWEILVSERDIRALVPLTKVRGYHLRSAPLEAWSQEPWEVRVLELNDPCTLRLRSW